MEDLNVANTEAIETTETTTETVEVANQATETAPEPPKPIIKAKYDKEDWEIFDEKEAAEYAQLGRYFKEKVAPEFESLKNSPERNFVLDMAKSYGMTPQEYIDAVNAQKQAEQIEAEKNERSQDEILQELMELREENTKYKSKEQIEYEQSQKQEAMNKDLQEFKQQFPDVDMKTIPDSVWERANQLENITKAYMEHEIQTLRELKLQLETQKSNETNAAASVGSAKGTSGDTHTKDFYTLEEAKELTSEDFKKDPSLIDKVKNSQKKW